MPITQTPRQCVEAFVIGAERAEPIIMKRAQQTGESATRAFPTSTYSTVTDFARFRGWSTFSPRFTAM
jgi:hypothetical protein